MPARGICGSGLVDTLAELFLNGIIGRTARFQNGQEAFVVVPATEAASGEDIVVTQIDINNFMATKGAVNAATEVLMGKCRVCLAGNEPFLCGRGVWPVSCRLSQPLRLAYILTFRAPPSCAWAIVLGKQLAKCFYLAPSVWKQKAIAAKVTYFELNASSSFMEKFVSSKFLPHTDLDRYPSVKLRLQTRTLPVDATEE